MEVTKAMERTDQRQARLCEHCRAVDFNHIMTKYYSTDLHGQHPETPLFQFGTVDEVNRRASHCIFCDAVAKAYNTAQVQGRPDTHWWLCSEPRYVGFLESRRQLRVLVAKLKTIQISAVGRSISNYHQFELLPTQQPLSNPSRTGGDLPVEQEQCTLPSQWPLARVLPATVHVRRIQQWRDLCHARHGDTCESPSWLGQEETLTGLRLIDVQYMCIVLVDAYIPPYAVLSYVWGASEYEQDGYTTQSTNLGERTQGQSLLNVHLPQTLTDAISLIPKLGLRYLWVEALCVVQDDASDKAKQAAQLGVICARAEFTMVAAASLSGADGLAILRAITIQQNRHTVQPADGLHFSSLPSPGYVHVFNNSDTRASPWLRYASSLLQGLTSKRLLIFDEHEVSWECLQDFWCEGLALEDPDPRVDDGGIAVREKRASSRFEPETLKSLLFRYSGLRVFPHQHESDRVDILASILRRFAHTTGEVFHWGLPCSHFSSALTWLCSTLPPTKLSPDGYKLPDPDFDQRRRALYPSRGPDGSVAAHIGIPSWSWLGWRGAYFGFRNGIMEQVYDDPEWFKIGLGGEVLPVSPVSADGTKNQRTRRAPWHESAADQGFPAGLFVPTPEAAARFVDSGKVGAWVSTSTLRVRDMPVEEYPPNEQRGRVSGSGSSATTQHKTALRWTSGGHITAPPHHGSAADDDNSSGRAEDENYYDFIAVAHDNRCGICVRNSVQRTWKGKAHVQLLWVEYRRSSGSPGDEERGPGPGEDEVDVEAERKGVCCIDVEVWMRARREWRWVQLF